MKSNFRLNNPEKGKKGFQREHMVKVPGVGKNLACPVYSLEKVKQKASMDSEAKEFRTLEATPRILCLI
jgi:hypothetical protein